MLILSRQCVQVTNISRFCLWAARRRDGRDFNAGAAKKRQTSVRQQVLACERGRYYYYYYYCTLPPRTTTECSKMQVIKKYHDRPATVLPVNISEKYLRSSNVRAAGEPMRFMLGTGTYPYVHARHRDERKKPK